MHKNEQKERAKALYIKSHGEIAPKEIAEKIGVKPEQIRKWKYREKWEEELKKPRRGAPRGNKNAVGHGAPSGNANAETHGAYSVPRLDRLPAEELEEIESLTEEFRGNALQQLKRLLAKRADLERRMRELEAMPQDKAELLDRSMTMIASDGKEIEYKNRSSPFTRRMTLEGELNRIDGRIIKLLDSIKGREMEEKRLELERERLEFARQKEMGVFVTGETDDHEEEEIVI